VSASGTSCYDFSNGGIVSRRASSWSRSHAGNRRSLS
jgi:hypothetical protein